ncbi:MAG: beta-ketoacyl synthase N-terminal-like domain-containing protein [Phycisphaerales bacterium]|jgi:3-oxoacyl-[acyl-carrier-protein] synthase II|nr:beta-ketoacyl synthase N-terminal-like domain-containing protein [Phycisphaerales bacterium]
MTQDVVITGIGPVTALGIGIDPLWKALEDGRTGIRRLEAFDATAWGCPFAGELPADEFSIRKIVPKHYRKATKVMCRDVELAVAAAQAATADAGLTTAGAGEGDITIPPHRMGCHIGAGLICADVNELAAALVTSQRDGAFDLHHWGREGIENLTPLWLLKYLPNMLACHVTIVHDCQGPSNTVTCWESSATLSLAESMRVIQRGAADACLTGGVESRLNVLATWRQECAGRIVTATTEDDPATLVRPFEPDAAGTVLGEGGGILVLESRDHAQARGAEIKAVISGMACTQSIDDNVLTAASAEAIGEAISLALSQADLEAVDLDAVVPMGLGITAIDTGEQGGIEAALGDHAAAIPKVLVTPATGNCCAGHGATQLAVAVQCIASQRLPGAAADLSHVLVITASQGGQNTATILSRGIAS